MKKIGILFLAALMLTGCSGGGENTDKTRVDAPENQVSATTAKSEERVLAMMGVADSEGYYTIDLPRSVEDLQPLEQINSRLYPVSIAMVQTDTGSFDKVAKDLVWRTVYYDIALNYGSIPPFTQRSDGDSTQISLTNLDTFIKDCFNTDTEVNSDSLPKEAALVGETAVLPYWEIDGKGVGFVMDAYKKEGNLWYIKGEIIAENNEIFSKGEFILEENGSQSQVSHKILSFNEKNSP